MVHNCYRKPGLENDTSAPKTHLNSSNRVVFLCKTTVFWVQRHSSQEQCTPNRNQDTKTTTTARIPVCLHLLSSPLLRNPTASSPFLPQSAHSPLPSSFISSIMARFVGDSSIAGSINHPACQGAPESVYDPGSCNLS